MKPTFGTLAVMATALAATSYVASAGRAAAQSEIPLSLVTPDKVETRIGTLEFTDGMPAQATVEKVYDNLDFVNVFQAFTYTMEGVSMEAIPAHQFWSLTLYENQTRSMLQTPQKYPRAGSQSFPSPAAEAAEDGSTTVWIAPEQPDGVARGNWIQTDPKKGWFTILRFYRPLPPFFDKSWRPGEIELVAN